jgi:hypothetical protein
MRLAVVPLAILGLVSCARHEEVRVASPSLIDEAPPPPPAEPGVSRPRLSQTVTLGQGAEQPYNPAVPPPAQPAPQAPSVVVVQPGYSGYGGYYGYYGYGGYPVYPRVAAPPRSFGPAWSSTGWEGARRTAGPGRTPGVGGNWPAAPSYGPATMK